MPFNFRGSTPADGSITEAKLANNAVTTAKIAPDAVTTDKVTADLATQHFLGTETELVHTGVTETTVGEFHFQKSSNPNENWKTIGWSGTKKSSVGTNTVDLNLYIDGNVTLSTGTTSTTYVTFEDDGFNISALADGEHFVELKIANSQALESGYLGRFDIYLSKKL